MNCIPMSWKWIVLPYSAAAVEWSLRHAEKTRVYLISEDRFSVGAGGWASRSSDFRGQMGYRIQYRVQRAYHSLVLLLLVVVVVVAVVMSMD